jgi:hypothetical protein
VIDDIRAEFDCVIQFFDRLGEALPARQRSAPAPQKPARRSAIRRARPPPATPLFRTLRFAIRTHRLPKLAAMPMTSEAAMAAPAVTASLFRRINLLNKYAAVGGRAVTISFARCRWRSRARPLACS